MSWLKRLYAKKWVRVLLGHVLGLGLVGLVISLASIFLGSACPSFLVFGICCPFCGMTRAHLAALRLDFATALYYHPVFFTGIPFLWLLFHQQFFRQKWQKVLWWVLVIGIGIALGATYITRIILYGFDFFA